MVCHHGLVAHFHRTLMPGGIGTTQFLVNPTQCQKFLVDSADHFRASVGSDNVRNHSGAQDAGHQSPRKISCLQATERFQLRNSENNTVVAKDIPFAPLGSCVRALHVNDDVRPGQLGPHAVIRRSTTQRRLNWPRSVTLAHFALTKPFVAIRAQCIPKSHSSKQLKALSRRTMRVQHRRVG